MYLKNHHNILLSLLLIIIILGCSYVLLTRWLILSLISKIFLFGLLFNAVLLIIKVPYAHLRFVKSHYFIKKNGKLVKGIITKVEMRKVGNKELNVIKFKLEDNKEYTSPLITDVKEDIIGQNISLYMHEDKFALERIGNKKTD